MRVRSSSRRIYLPKHSVGCCSTDSGPVSWAMMEGMMSSSVTNHHSRSILSYLFISLPALSYFIFSFCFPFLLHCFHYPHRMHHRSPSLHRAALPHQETPNPLSLGPYLFWLSRYSITLNNSSMRW